MATFMRGFKSPNTVGVTKGKKSGTMSDFKSPNSSTPAPPVMPQSNMVPNMSGPIKTGKGALGRVK